MYKMMYKLKDRPPIAIIATDYKELKVDIDSNRKLVLHLTESGKVVLTDQTDYIVTKLDIWDSWDEFYNQKKMGKYTLELLSLLGVRNNLQTCTIID